MQKVRKCNKFCKSTNLQIFRGLGEDDSWRYLKQIILWHCPFKAKHQRTKECIDVTSQNFIKILSRETFPLKSNNSIYKITTPSYWVEEEICRRMPRKFLSSTQFQRKRKSLVFFQSINFLCSKPTGPMYFVFCRLNSSSPSYYGSVWLLPVISLLLINTVPPARACLSIWLERFRESQKRTIVGLLVFNSSRFHDLGFTWEDEHELGDSGHILQMVSVSSLLPSPGCSRG